MGAAMDLGVILSLTPWLALPVAFFLCRRRFDPGQLGFVRADPEPQELCWTEQIASDGDRSCHRAYCVNDELMEMDRAAAGELAAGD